MSTSPHPCTRPVSPGPAASRSTCFRPLPWHGLPARVLPPSHLLPARVFRCHTTRFHPISSAHQHPNPCTPLGTSTLDPKDVENLRPRPRCETPLPQPLTAAPLAQVNRNTHAYCFASAGGMPPTPALSSRGTGFQPVCFPKASPPPNLASQRNLPAAGPVPARGRTRKCHDKSLQRRLVAP